MALDGLAYRLLLCVIRYAWFYGRAHVGKTTVIQSVSAVVIATMAVSAITLVWGAALPKLMVGGQFSLSGVGLAVQIFLCVIVLTALFSTARLGTPTPEHLWLIVGLVATCSEVWLTLSGSGRYTLGWYVSKFESLLTSLVVLVSIIRDINGLYREAALANRKLSELALRDFLTNLFNRRFFDERLEQELRMARRQSWPLSLIMIDVDHFKAYNDRYGHPAGDVCLQRVSAAISAVLQRPSDCAARYGGEEMAVLLPATEIKGALIVAERLRETIAALAIDDGRGGFAHVTISLGLACSVPSRLDQSASELVKEADRALYQAKEAGRNRVVCAC